MSKGCQTAGYRKPSRVTFRGICVLICVLMGCFQHTTTRYLGCLIYTKMKWGKTWGSFKFAWYLVLMLFFLTALAADSSSNHNTNGYFSQQVRSKLQVSQSALKVSQHAQHQSPETIWPIINMSHQANYINSAIKKSINKTEALHLALHIKVHYFLFLCC